jgi:phosphoribosylformylglycinamidine synthase
MGISGGMVPGLDFDTAPRVMNQLHAAIGKGLVLACHDLSEGGLALSLAEMSLSGNIGVEIDIEGIPFLGGRKRYDTILFSESNTRFLVEVREENVAELIRLFDDLPIVRIGSTVIGDYVRIRAGDRKIVDLPISLLRKKWLRKVS